VDTVVETGNSSGL
jgi:IS5 family transposase